MSKLYTSDTAVAGVWRAYVIETFQDGSVRVYIPTLQRHKMPFKNKDDFSQGIIEGCEGNYPIANAIWWKVRTQLNVGDPVWVMFENGNINYPILAGVFGTKVPLASEFSGSYAPGGGIASFGDSTVIDMSGQLDEHGTISNVQYLILHTSGCHTVESLINVLNSRDGLGVQAATDDKAIYKLCTEWNALMYHCGGVNSKAIGCEMIESPHIKWNSNMTAIPDQDYMKEHIDEIISWHDKCYNNAVNLFAYWCITFNLDETKIYSHKESSKIGGTSDHADPEELWDYFVKHTGDKKWTMDEFRKAVKERIPKLRVSDTSGGAGGAYAKYIFVGDSRTVGMHDAIEGSYINPIDRAGTKNTKDYYIAEVGMGYDWFVKSSTQNSIKSQIVKNSAIIILLGFNGMDYYSGEKYATFVKSKASEWQQAGATVYFVSVNPMDDAKAHNAKPPYPKSLTNSDVIRFNNELKTNLSGSSIKYIDTYSQIKDTFSAPGDGIHYGNETYKKIYNIIKGQ